VHKERKAHASDAGSARAHKSDDSPIVLVRLTCPVCRTVNECETVRTGAYVEEGTDTDFRPLARRWTNPRYQAVNPLLYFMATCTTCFYTREFNRASRESGSDSELTTEQQKEFRLKHLAMLADTAGVARRLGNSLWSESFPLQTAISKFVLGVLDENLAVNPSNYDLARWYLRVAWLFREAHPHGKQDLTSPSAQSRRDLERSLDEIAADVTRLRGRVEQVVEFLQAQPQAAKSHPDDYQGPMECRQRLQHLAELTDGLQKEFADMRRTVLSPTEDFVGVEPKNNRDAFGDHASYTEFLKSLKLDCPHVPVNEIEAMTFALTHYKLAFESQGGIERGNGAMLTAYLIGELSRRLAQYEEAERYLDMARVAAHVAIRENANDRPRSALARHLADLADRQSRCLYDTSLKLG